ncbi:hypothetical protein ACIPSR_19725 [Pectobacterium sp. CHL-2024]|uniref:hypothetical protein n=1 Tax=Pectobacterium TaxID=122277 RepID=UPI001CF39350|nr:hypothetical protein [Pectobacterium brasiliense]MCA6983270.1 hypothetical protein [Pectobacterium brasiliense]
MYNNLYALTQSLFWVDRLLDQEYENIELSELLIELDEYNKKIDSLIIEKTNSVQESRLNVYMAGNSNIEKYKSGLFSMDRVILDDVLYSLSLRYSVNLSENVVGKFIEKDIQEKVEHLRKEISRFIRFAKENFDLIRGDFIVFVRRESAIRDSERANGILDDNADANFIFQYLPRNIASLYENRLSVKNIERLSNTNKIRLLHSNILANEIMLEIKNCESPYTNGYMYQHIKNAIDNGDGTMSMEIVMGKHSGKKSYERWVQGAKNRTTLFHYKNLITDLNQAYSGKASLGTYCPFHGEILRKLDQKNEVQRVKLSIDVPFLEGLTPRELYKIRTDYESSFNSFRSVLREAAYDIEAESDPYKRQLINQHFVERVWDEGLTDIEQKIQAYKRKSRRELFLNITPSLIGFIGAPNSVSLTTGAFTILKEIFNLTGHSSEIRSHPSYFLLMTSKSKK